MPIYLQLLKLPDRILEITHGDTSQTEVEYRLAWSRTYLKKYGLLENSARGVWSLVSTSIQLEELDAKEIVRFVRDADRRKLLTPSALDGSVEVIETECIPVMQ